MEIIKFRIYNPEEKRMVESGATPMMLHSFFEYTARFNTQLEMPYQQFTGLSDSHSKEIYEGDILQVPVQGGEKYEVVFNDGGFTVKNIDSKSAMPASNEYLKVFAKQEEIIGNVYENPDLLKI